MPWFPRPRYLVPMIVACALFMENMDATVIATALPTIAHGFGESPLRLNLAITCYLLSLGIFLPLSGWLADRFGARIVQGMGGAMMVPVGRLVVLRSIPKAELVAAMAYLTVPALIGPVIGPPLGGFIVTYFSWRWIFWINIPIGLLGIALALRFVPNIREARDEALDGAGFGMVSLGLAGTMFGFENVGRGILSNDSVTALLVGGLAFLAAYGWHARRVDAPIIDVTLLRIRTFRASVLGGFLFRNAIGALPFLTPLMLQLGFGLTPFASGMITFSGAAGALFMKITAPAILRALGFRRVLLLNTVVCAVSIACYGLFRPSTPHAVIIGVLLVGGFFRSLQFTSLNTLAYADVEQPKMSRATTLASVGQQLSLSFGVGLGALLLHTTLAVRGRDALGAADFSPAYFTISAISLLSLLFFARLRDDAGAEISGNAAAAAAQAAAEAEPSE